MIGRLSGKLIEINPPNLLLSVNGVGYEVAIPADTLFQLPQIGSDLILWTHLVVREDAHLLFGFTSTAQRDLFRQLIRISGVGPKVALSIISTFSQEQLSEIVQSKSVDWLTKIPGVGKKMAERLLVELATLADKWSTASLDSNKSTFVPGAHEDVVGALIGLGYKEKQARSALSKVSDDVTDAQDLIKAALKELSSL